MFNKNAKDKGSSGKRAAPQEDGRKDRKRPKKAQRSSGGNENKHSNTLSAEERKRYFAENLCFKCGKPGHRANDCSESSENQKGSGDKDKSQAKVAGAPAKSKNHKA